MKAIENGLVVEDEEDWQIFFAEALEAEGLQVRVAADLQSAKNQLAEMAFGIALVDMRLVRSDPANRDGLQVLDLISRLDDDTSALVVTAEGDFRVARDALRVFNAFDAVEKVQVSGEPAALAQYVRRALDAHQFKRSSRTIPLYNFLRGSKMAWDWDYEVQRVVSARGGIQTIYRFLEELLRDMVPAVPRQFGESAVVNQQFGVIVGEYWSRNHGVPVLVVFGNEERVSAYLEADDPGSPGFSLLYREDRRLMDRVRAEVRGVIIALGGRDRSNYVSPVEWS